MRSQSGEGVVEAVQIAELVLAREVGMGLKGGGKVDIVL